MHLLTVDGRQVDSRGVTLTEMGQMMAQLGAHHALNLDGGGSSTMLAREPGSADACRWRTSPPTAASGPCPTAWPSTPRQDQGSLSGYWVETATDPRDAPGLSPVRGGRPDRVFPGLTRRLTAAGYDETYGPAAGTPHWRVPPPGTA